MAVLMPLEIKHHTIPYLKALTHSIEHTNRECIGSTFKQHYTVLKRFIVLNKLAKCDGSCVHKLPIFKRACFLLTAIWNLGDDYNITFYNSLLKIGILPHENANHVWKEATPLVGALCKPISQRRVVTAFHTVKGNKKH